MAEAGELVYFFEQPVYSKDALFFKSSKIPTDSKYEVLHSYLTKAVSLLESISESDFNDKEKVKEAIWPYAEEVGRGDVLWPMRFALSGCEKSPDPFTLASVLGKEETLARLEKALELLK
jgi:glutamyl/glutaminyl-tRNA synthetase